MPAKSQTSTKTNPGEPLTLRDLAEVLIRHYKITEGKFDVSVEFHFAAGGVGIGPSPSQKLPGIIVGVHRIGLTPSVVDGPHTVDASNISKARKSAKEKS